MYLKLFLVGILTSPLLADDCPNNDNSHLMAVKLKKDLTCNYDETIIPVKDHKKSINVSFRMIIKSFEFSETTSTFSLESWLVMIWKDEHLVWKPSDYGDIDSIVLSTDLIWSPDISIYNRATEVGDPRVIESVRCIVRSTGIVTCIPPLHAQTYCVANMEKYPYDQQNCSISFGSWSHKGEEVNFTIGENAMDQIDLVENGEWELKTMTARLIPGKYECCPNDTYPSVHFGFIIRRLAGAHTATIVIPGIVVIVLTLTSLWISPTNPDRMFLCFVNMMTQFFHMQNISWLVPLKGQNISLLILFARDSLLLCAFTILFTVVLKSLMLRKTIPPAWVSSIVSFVIGCRCGKFVLLSDYSTKGLAKLQGEDDGTSMVANAETNSNSEDWVVFARILDRLCFISYSFVYFFMFIAFAP